MCTLLEDRPSIYPTTRWTDIIEVIQRGADDESLVALGNLFELYRPAIHAFFARFNRERADDLTSAFFESQVIVPWNRRHGSLSPLYREEDVRRLKILAQDLRLRKRPLTEYLWGIFRESTRSLLVNDADHEGQTDGLREMLVVDLNAIIQGASLFDAHRFSDVVLSVETRNLMQKEPKGNWLVWLNRSLLADAFPGHLTKGVGFLYMVERQERSKFRAFLAHAMWWFLKDVTKAQMAQSAGSGRTGTSLEALAEVGFEPPDGGEEKFGRQLDEEFAHRVLALAGKRFQHSKQLEAHLRGEMSQKQAAKELDLSENAFRQCYLRFRCRLAEALREEVTRLVGPDEAEIRAEMNYLMKLLVT